MVVSIGALLAATRGPSPAKLQCCASWKHAWQGASDGTANEPQLSHPHKYSSPYSDATRRSAALNQRS